MDSLTRCIELWTELTPGNGYHQIIKDAPVTRFSEAVVADVKSFLNPELRRLNYQPLDPLDDLDPELWKLNITKTHVHFVFSLEALVDDADVEKLIEIAYQKAPGIASWEGLIEATRFGDYHISIRPQTVEDLPNDKDEWPEALRDEQLYYDIVVYWSIANTPERRQQIANLIKLYQIRLQFRKFIDDPEYRQNEIEANMLFSHEATPRIDCHRLCVSCCLARCQCQ